MRTELLAVCVLLAFGVGCARKETITRRPTPVRVMVVSATSPDDADRSYTGNVRAMSNVPIAFRVGGYVVDAGDRPALLNAGDRVKVGQVLARVRQADYQATQQQASAGVGSSQALIFQARSKVSEAEAALAQAIAGVEEARAKRGSAVAQVAEAEHAVQQAQGALAEARAGREQASATLDQALAGNAKARSDYTRAKTLLAAKAATQAEFDAAQAQLDSSNAQVQQAREAIRGIDAKELQAQAVIRQARSKVAEAQGQVRAADAAIVRLGESKNAATAAIREAHGLVGQANSGLRASTAQQRTASLALQDSSLSTPVEGTVIARKIEIGALVGPGTVGFIVADTRQMKVTFSVSDADHGQFTLDSNVPFRVEGRPQVFQGTVTSVSPSADPSTRLFEIELTVGNPKSLLKQGMVATVTPKAPRAAAGLSVPFAALIGDQSNGQAVFLVVDGKLRKTPIRLGRIIGDKVEVIGGLQPGDVVVSEGAGMLADGDEVEVLH